jgi:carbon monoxide dehydrogenase subunit G
MQSIRVTHTIQAPAEQVFDILADHANYKLFPGVSDSKLLTPGKKERDGVGAVREVKVGAARFVEEITHYQRPSRLDYLIVRSFPPVQHKGGSIRLEPSGGGTLVTWTSEVRLRLPLLGGLLTPLLCKQLSEGFLHTLKAVEKRLPGKG